MQLEKQIKGQQVIFMQYLNTFNSAIDVWKQKYLLIAPVTGKLIYSGIIQENQSLQAGQQIFFIQPPNTQFFGTLIIAQRSFGRIKEGQKVLVRFSGYPAREFGTVAGQVAYLSDFPVRDSSFVAKIRFPNGLKTNYGRTLPPVNGMNGTAEIITQDMRLLERFYNNIIKQIQ